MALLWPVAMLNYLDRQMVSTIRASIRADIPSIANDQDFGTLMAVFMWVYAFLSPVGGFIADKFNRRWTVIGSLFVWSAVTWLTGHAQTYSQMLSFRALMGISEAFYIPAALALIADFHTGGTRPKADRHSSKRNLRRPRARRHRRLHRANEFVAELFHLVRRGGRDLCARSDFGVARRAK